MRKSSVPQVDPSVEAAANLAALGQVLSSLDGAATVEEATSRALAAVREAFGWDYGSYWQVAPTTRCTSSSSRGARGRSSGPSLLPRPSARGSACRVGRGGPATSSSCPTSAR